MADNEATQGGPQGATHSAPGELMIRAFGPLADALGLELAKFPPFAVRNLTRLVESFQRKSKQRSEYELSPRLLRQVIDEAAWSDDEILTEYLGGVLAASGKSVTNDRGVAITSVIRRLSALQLRTHYIFYNELLRAKLGLKKVDLRYRSNRYHVEFELEEFLNALDLQHLDSAARRDMLDHLVLGLAREELIDEESWEYVTETTSDVRRRAPHVAFHPSPLGAELFLWGCGSPVTDQSRLFDPALELVLYEQISHLSHTKLGDKDEEYDSKVQRVDDHLRAEQLDDMRESASELVNDRPHQAPGYFYLAIASNLDGDIQSAEELMRKSSLRATEGERKTGLRTLGRMMVEYPSRSDSFLALARILEQEGAR